MKYILVALCLLPGCFTRGQRKVRHITLSSALQHDVISSEESSEQKAYPITLWIHGTRLVPQGFFERFLYVKPGLHHYTETPQRYRMRRIIDAAIAGDPERFVPLGFYMFGWSGSLSFVERREAAEDLYIQLQALRASYVEKFKQEPPITIITHSHGGNVALHLADVADQNDVAFVIEKLILLACPVQIKTACNVQHKVFKKIYSLYSSLDLFQVIDPQGFYTRFYQRNCPLFSCRTFAECPNVIQMECIIDKRPCAHIDFIRMQFMNSLGHIIRTIENWEEEADESWYRSKKMLCLHT